jgi:hypothetical protein
MGGVIARAPRIDGRRAGAEGAAGKPMPGNAVPRLQLPGGFAPTEHHGALTRGAGPMRNGSRPGSWRGALTRGAGPMTNGLRAGSWRGALTRGAGPMTNGSRPGSVAGCSRVEAVR